jgi:hypothetical protein
MVDDGLRKGWLAALISPMEPVSPMERGSREWLQRLDISGLQRSVARYDDRVGRQGLCAS